MRKYFEIGKINFLNNIIYFWEFVFRAIFLLLILFIFTNLWRTVYSGQESIVGFTIAMMVWYMLVTEAIFMSSHSLVKEVNKEIQSGDIAYQLNKPYSYIFYHLAKSLSYRILGFFITFAFGAVFVYINLGGFAFNYLNILFIVFAVLLAFILDFFMTMSLALLAFWFEDTNAFKWVYDKFIFTIGGMLVPLEIFPFWLAKISQALPFSFVSYYPAKLFVKFDFTLFSKVIAAQLGYILVFALICFWIYRIGIRRVNINGG